MALNEHAEKRSKYREVIDFIQQAIASGKYPEGARLPSESELVKQFGASRPTISRAMQELQASGAIHRRAGSGSFVSEKTAAGDTEHRLFGVLIPRLGDTEIFESICGQIVREAEVGRHGLLWADLSTSNGRLSAERTCERYIRQRVSGVFFAPQELSEEQDEFNRQIVSILDEAGIPIVLLDRDFAAFPARSGCDLVGIDNYAVGYMLGRHMAESGCRRVAFFARPYSASTVQTRISGAFCGLMDAGQTPSQDWVKLADASDVNAVRNMMESAKPDGIVCANDKTAAELMNSLAQLDYRVPNDVKVAGVDDVHYAKLLLPGLTTVHQPCREIGTVAMRVMLDRLANPDSPVRTVLLGTSLVVRQSTGRQR